MDRKKFIRNSAATFSALFAANWGSRAEIRAFKDPQKPLLTEKTLAHVLSRAGSRDKFTSKLDQAINEPEAFLYQNFSLSPIQKQVVASFTEQDWQQIVSVLRKGKELNTELKFTFEGAAGKDACTKFISIAVGNRGQVLQEIAIVPAIAMAQGGVSTVSNPINSAESTTTASTAHWRVSPNSSLRGVNGRLNLSNLPKDAQWQVDIYREPGNKFLQTFYSEHTKDSGYALGPGNYTIKLMHVPLESVPVQTGHDTELKFGMLNVVSERQWDVYKDTKYLLTSYKPKKIVLPPGEYNLKLGGQEYTVVIKEGKTEEY